MDTGREVSIIEDKGNADLTRTMGHKCRISDRENTDTYLHKQEEQSKFLDENACFTYSSYLFKEGNGLLYQVLCWEKTVNSENICKDYPAIGHQ